MGAAVLDVSGVSASKPSLEGRLLEQWYERTSERLGFEVAPVRTPLAGLASIERRGVTVIATLNAGVIASRLQPFALSWLIREWLSCRDGFRALCLSDLDVGPALADLA